MFKNNTVYLKYSHYVIKFAKSHLFFESHFIKNLYFFGYLFYFFFFCLVSGFPYMCGQIIFACPLATGVNQWCTKSAVLNVNENKEACVSPAAVRSRCQYEPQYVQDCIRRSACEIRRCRSQRRAEEGSPTDSAGCRSALKNTRKEWRLDRRFLDYGTGIRMFDKAWCKLLGPKSPFRRDPVSQEAA